MYASDPRRRVFWRALFIVLVLFVFLGGATVLGLALGVWSAIRAVGGRDARAAGRAAWLGVIGSVGTLGFLAATLHLRHATPAVGSLRLTLALLGLGAAVSATGIARAWTARESRSGAAAALCVLLGSGACAAHLLRESSLRMRLARIAWAASAGHAGAVKRETDGAAIGRAPLYGREPILVLAAAGGSVDALSALLAAGVDPRDPANQAGRALVSAARGGHVEVVRLLLSRGVDPNVAAAGEAAAHREIGWPAYMAWARVTEPVKGVLRSAGARDLDVYEGKRAALHEAALAGDTARFRALQNEGVFGLEELEAEVLEATRADRAELVLAAGASGRVLRTAIQADARRTFRMLLPRLTKRHERQEALDLACRAGRLEMVTLIVEGEEARERALQDPARRGVDLPVRLDEKLGVDDRTPLESAARGGHAEVVAYLLSRGAAREARLLEDPEVRRHPDVVSLLEAR